MTNLQLNRFYVNTMHMLDVWFGDAQHTEASQLISDRLFASGVFGTHESSLQSTMLKKVNKRGSVQDVKLLNWFYRAFPAYSGMRQLYPVLRKWPILLPAMCVARWGTCCSINEEDLSSTCRKYKFRRMSTTVTEFQHHLFQSCFSSLIMEMARICVTK